MDSRTEGPCADAHVFWNLFQILPLSPWSLTLQMSAWTPATHARAIKFSKISRSIRHCGMCLYRLLSATTARVKTVSAAAAPYFIPPLLFLCCLHCLSAFSTQLPFVLLISPQPLPPPPLMPPVLQLELLSPTLLPPPLLLPPPRPPPSPHPPLGTTASSLMKTARPVC